MDRRMLCLHALELPQRRVHVGVSSQAFSRLVVPQRLFYEDRHWGYRVVCSGALPGPGGREKPGRRELAWFSHDAFRRSDLLVP